MIPTKKSFSIAVAALLLCGTCIGQSITLNWIQTETYQVENANGNIYVDDVNHDVVHTVAIWVDMNNQVHARALNRRNVQGQMVQDTNFNNNSYLDYEIKGVFPKNGETYYCLSYQNSYLIYVKIDAAGQLLWQQSFPLSRFFFCNDWNQRGNNYVIDDSLSNRVLWCFEQWNPTYTAKSVGVLATDNATGAITILDTINFTGVYCNIAFAIEMERDNNGHIYLSCTDDTGGLRLCLLDNGQFVTEFALDSAGMTYNDYPQSMTIVGNTLFLATQTEITYNYRISKLWIFSIDAAGHLTLQSVQTIGDTQQFLTGLESSGNLCYVYTSGYLPFAYPQLTPTIWVYDNAGNLANTFALTNFTGSIIYDIAITNKALYCNMYSSGSNVLEVIHPATGAHLTGYNLQPDFPGELAQQLEARSTGPATDILYAGGNQRISNLQGRVAKYSFTGLETGNAETGNASVLNYYPVPAGDQLFVEYKGTGDILYEVLDAQGRVVSAIPAQGPRQSLDLRGLAAGTYFLRITDAEQVTVRRFIKE